MKECHKTETGVETTVPEVYNREKQKALEMLESLCGSVGDKRGLQKEM